MSQDFARGLIFWLRDFLARQIEAGYTVVNAHGPSAMDNNGPFGGFKNSGIGRNFGYEGVTQFQGFHSIAGWLCTILYGLASVGQANIVFGHRLLCSFV